MEKKGLRKLQLTRETLRNLSTDELSRVVGGTIDTNDCAETILPCNLDPLPTAVGCNGTPSDDLPGCYSSPDHCNSSYTCSPAMCG
jgi:hypothetical protein